jgi:hypothetical protein
MASPEAASARDRSSRRTDRLLGWIARAKRCRGEQELDRTLGRIRSSHSSRPARPSKHSSNRRRHDLQAAGLPPPDRRARQHLADGPGPDRAERARRDVWHPSARADFLPEQHAINELLAKLSTAERETVAQMLQQEVVTGMFETLKALETFGIPPFEAGYEGSPYEDFIGRVDDWEWPE